VIFLSHFVAEILQSDCVVDVFTLFTAFMAFTSAKRYSFSK